MIKFSKIIRFWGLCDLGYILWWLTWNIFHDRIPFYSDYIESTVAIEALGLGVRSYPRKVNTLIN